MNNENKELMIKQNAPDNISDVSNRYYKPVCRIIFCYCTLAIYNSVFLGNNELALQIPVLVGVLMGGDNWDRKS
jgi:hypothetical protein